MVRNLLLTLCIATLASSCSGNSDAKKDGKNKKDTAGATKDTTTVNHPVKDTISKKPGADTTGQLGETKTLKLIFVNYEEGDYAHTIFKETGNGEEWDFGHPEENKLNGIHLVLKDEKTGWGYRANKKMVGKTFIVQVIYKTLDGMDLDGKAIKYNDWRITDLKEVK